MMEILRRIGYLWNRSRLEEELANEMEFHREMAERAGGLPLGNALHLREEARDAWGWTWVERLGQDLRYAGRMLRRSPGFTLAAVLILAIGIGVNVAAFGFFNLMVLRPLPVRDPATLLRFQRQSPKAYASVLPYPELEFFREHSRTLAAMLAWAQSNVTMEGEAKPVRVQFATANLFTELGGVPEAGRLFDAAHDGAPGSEPVVVLSYGFWERQFGGDRGVEGRIIRLNGKAAVVAGVAAREFSGLNMETPDAWAPIVQQPYFVPGSKLLTDYSVEGSGVTAWGRLRPGLTPRIAEEELASLAAVLHREHPADIWEKETLPADAGAYVKSTMSHSHHGTGAKDPDKIVPVAAMIAALVMLILAVACSNLGSLLLARGVARDREIAIRIAVGAGKGRLVRQLFTESVVLGLLGSALGMGLGYVVLRGLMAASGTPPWLDAAPDWRVGLFAVAMGFAAAIVFGLAPALQIARQRHRASLMRQVLIAAQVAASCVLLIVAGLLVRALNHAAADPGFEYQRVVTIDPSLGGYGYTPAKAREYLETLKGRLRGVAGVESVAAATNPPFGNKTSTIGMEMDGRAVSIHTNSVEPQFFQTMKIALLRGRNLANGDVRVVVISQSLAAILWPAEDALGKLFEVGSVKYTVVGIAANARSTAPQERDGAEAYFPAGANDLNSMAVLVRTSGNPEGLAATLTAIGRGVDAEVAPEVQLMKTGFERSLRGTEYGALAVGVLAMVALLLACLGIVGLVAYAVSQRTKEIGIRMALGARPAQILSIVMRQFSRPVGVGLLVGVGGAVGLSRVLRQILFGVGALDPAAYVGAVGIFAVTVVLAALAPARRALRVDPMRALRND